MPLLVEKLRKRIRPEAPEILAETDLKTLRSAIFVLMQWAETPPTHAEHIFPELDAKLVGAPEAVEELLEDLAVLQKLRKSVERLQTRPKRRRRRKP